MNITIMSTMKILFKGPAQSVTFPGDTGVFEVMSYHKRLISRLLKGNIDVDGKQFPISRGVVKVDKNEIMVVVEEQ